MSAVVEDKPRILCVDDETLLLESLRDRLRREYRVVTATRGAEGLERLAAEPFAVVVSDMRMPGMDGATFLARSAQVQPEAVRILLTGHTELEAAIAAVNQGQVFRFLTKPCPHDALTAALSDAVDQHRMVTGDRILTQQKLDRMADELLRAERLATLGSLAGTVGHEMNNALAVLVVALDTVQEEARAGRPVSGDVLEDLQLVREHLETHARSLLHLARPPAEAETEVDLVAVTRGVVRTLRHSGLAKGAQVDLDVPGYPVPVHAHRTRLEQVLINLVKNASDAVSGRPDARIVVRVRLADEGEAVLEVEDNGCGIDAVSLPRIFDLYYSVKQRDEGTGLGLPIVRRIVEGFQGTIDVASEVGVGTTFRATLPPPGRGR